MPFSRHLEVAGTEPPGAVGPFPAEQRADDEDLPRLEREWRSGPFAFAVVQTGKEPNRALDGGEIERESSRMPVRLLCQLPIATVARAGLPHQPARRHLACEHRIGIRENFITLRHHPASSSSSASGSRLIGSGRRSLARSATFRPSFEAIPAMVAA